VSNIEGHGFGALFAKNCHSASDFKAIIQPVWGSPKEVGVKLLR